MPCIVPNTKLLIYLHILINVLRSQVLITIITSQLHSALQVIVSLKQCTIADYFDHTLQLMGDLTTLPTLIVFYMKIISVSYFFLLNTYSLILNVKHIIFDRCRLINLYPFDYETESNRVLNASQSNAK